MGLVSRAAPVIFTFDLDQAWTELKTLWDLVKYWSFSFTTYNVSISNGVISSTPQTKSKI